MIDRQLQIIYEGGAIYALFNKYICGKITRKKYLLTIMEAARAKSIIATGDIFAIDNFCYSIS